MSVSYTNIGSDTKPQWIYFCTAQRTFSAVSTAGKYLTDILMLVFEF